jgi:hypothetical protein
MITVYAQGKPLPVDDHLLLRQAAALGRILGPPLTAPTPHETELLRGVWHMLHDILDAAERLPSAAIRH